MKERMQRVSELIKREVALILQTDIEDPETRNVTITDIEVSKDLRMAKVFYVFPQEVTDREFVRKALQSHARYIRGELGRRISIRYIPRLTFMEDELEGYRRKVDELFEKIDGERTKQKGARDEQ